jgi:hypothetical protein
MTTPHPHAEILRAIADGKQAQIRNDDHWDTVDASVALYHLGQGFTVRIAPETITVNGVECPENMPAPYDHTNWIVNIEYGTAYTGQRTSCRLLTFDNQADAKTVYDALCKPFLKEGV